MFEILPKSMKICENRWKRENLTLLNIWEHWKAKYLYLGIQFPLGIVKDFTNNFGNIWSLRRKMFRHFAQKMVRKGPYLAKFSNIYVCRKYPSRTLSQRLSPKSLSLGREALWTDTFGIRREMRRKSNIIKNGPKNSDAIFMNHQVVQYPQKWVWNLIKLT